MRRRSPDYLKLKTYVKMANSSVNVCMCIGVARHACIGVARHDCDCFILAGIDTPGDRVKIINIVRSSVRETVSVTAQNFGGDVQLQSSVVFER